MVILKFRFIFLFLCFTLIQGIGSAKELVIHENFNEKKRGPYMVDNLKADFGEIVWHQGIEMGRGYISQDSDNTGGKFLKVSFPAKNFGSKASGLSWRSRLPTPLNQAKLSFRVKFPKTFDFKIGGKLPGLMGGTESTALRKSDGTKGFSVRLMWLKDGLLSSYVYHANQKKDYGDFFEWRKEGVPFRFEKNRWYTIEQEITLNDPAKSNGQIRGWIDETLYLYVENLRFRKSTNYAIDSLVFSTFYGGHDIRWAPDKDQWIFFDDLIVSK